MMTAVGARAAGGGALGAARPAGGVSRKTRVVAAAAALVVVLLVAALVAASRSYGPLLFQGGSVAPDAPPGVDYRVVHSIEPGGRPAYAVDHRAAGTFELGFDVTNGGRLPLTLERVPDDPLTYIRTSLRISAQDSFEHPNDLTYVGVDGITIDPGEHRRLVVTYRWSRCEDAASGGGLASREIEVHYTLFGLFRRTQYVDAPAAVVLVCGDLPRVDSPLVEPGL